MLELKNVCKTFNPGTSNEVTALCGVDLNIDEVRVDAVNRSAAGFEKRHPLYAL